MKLVFTLIVAGLVALGCGKKEATSNEAATAKPAAVPEKKMEEPATTPAGQSGDTTITASGLKFIELKPGTGASPTTGQTCVMHYTGWLTDGKKFDSSRDRGQPFEFKIGMGQVIKGWDEGVATMKIGGQRKLIIKPELGYGARNVGNGLIPPNSTLIFDVELLGVK